MPIPNLKPFLVVGNGAASEALSRTLFQEEVPGAGNMEERREAVGCEWPD